MASPAVPMQPPPGADDSSAPQAPPTSPQSASPAPATPSPVLDQGSTMLVNIVKDLLAVSKMFPGASPGIAKINEIIRGEIMPAITQSAEPGEPQAPPIGG